MMDGAMRRNVHAVLLMADPKISGRARLFAALRRAKNEARLFKNIQGEGMHGACCRPHARILLCGAAVQASAEETGPIKIGVIAESSGSTRQLPARAANHVGDDADLDRSRFLGTCLDSRAAQQDSRNAVRNSSYAFLPLECF